MADFLTSRSDEGFSENLAQLDALGLLANTWEAARDEYLGIDDFRRMLRKGAEGNLLGALKSGATGALELGTTLLPGLSAAKFAKVSAAAPKASKVLKFFGAGAKTPARGLATNVGVGAGLTGGTALAGKALGRFLGRGAAVPMMAAQSMYDPYRSVRPLISNSPATADSEALVRLMIQQGMI